MVIVGGGHGGAQAAVALRQLGFAGRIAIVSQEPDPPYERPPLSKDYLAGDKPFERMLIRPADFWAERAVDLLLGLSAVEVRPDEKIVRCAPDREIGYGRLIWAAGGTPYRLRCVGGDLAGVYSIRCRGDVDALKAQLPTVERVAIVGAGYIGLEAAAVLTKLGKKVTLLETAERVLSRVAGEPLSRFYEQVHHDHGVELRLGATVEAIEGDGKVRGLRLAGGEHVAAELVVVAIGIGATVGPLLAAGALGGGEAGGVAVDEFMRTSLSDVYAIGDCAAHANRFAGGAQIRLESVQNAHDQATAAAKAIVGRPEPYDALPWFWSNQYDLRLQTVGLWRGCDDIVVRGDPGRGSFSVVYLKQGAVIALDCVNATKDYVQGRKLILEQSRPGHAALANADVPLKAL